MSHEDSGLYHPSILKAEHLNNESGIELSLLKGDVAMGQHETRIRAGIQLRLLQSLLFKLMMQI